MGNRPRFVGGKFGSRQPRRASMSLFRQGGTRCLRYCVSYSTVMVVRAATSRAMPGPIVLARYAAMMNCPLTPLGRE